MDKFIAEYKQFLDDGKTERECVREILALAEKKGYRNIAGFSSLKPGDKVYVNKMDKSVALFCIGRKDLAEGMHILGAHIDSPRLDVKQNPVYEKDGIVYLNTHYYGGIKKYQWLTLPLAIHGEVFLTDGTSVSLSIGEKPDDPVFSISDILPHIAQEQMKKSAADFIDAENLDLVLGAFAGKDTGKKVVLEVLKRDYGIEEEDFQSAELEIVPAGAARDSGFCRDLILAYGQDDRVCAFASLKAMLDIENPEMTASCILVDKEEIGSYGATGMRSHFYDNAVAEVVARTSSPSELTVRRCLANSWMLSSDVNSAFDPLNADLYDKQNSSGLAQGVVFNKYTGGKGKSGSSDANPEFIAKLRKVMSDGKVTYQFAEMAKVDVGGGGTIAHMAATFGMQVIDCGVPVLSMHAPWELTSKFDAYQAYLAYGAFFTLK
ncbi:MAG: aminopeptidase [Spirochaetia bacterium]|jgi:aspartyl aminopeptidase|nr:aminopeptidase [Spirochaetia bacterium]